MPTLDGHVLRLFLCGIIVYFFCSSCLRLHVWPSCMAVAMRPYCNAGMDGGGSRGEGGEVAFSFPVRANGVRSTRRGSGCSGRCVGCVVWVCVRRVSRVSGGREREVVSENLYFLPGTRCCLALRRKKEDRDSRFMLPGLFCLLSHVFGLVGLLCLFVRAFGCLVVCAFVLSV